MSVFRIMSSPKDVFAGSSSVARPGFLTFQQSGAIATACALLTLGSSTALLDGSWATGIACVLMLIVGLPHGALDIATLRRVAPNGQAAVICCYLAAGAAMFAIWSLSPLVALVVFYLIAMIHFADDWREAPHPFFAHAIVVAMLSAPALTHAAVLERLFIALTGDPSAAWLVDTLVLTAPVSIAVSIVGLATIGPTRRAVEGVCTLAATLVLPPVLGFAVFFCLFHSPRHFREGWTALGPNVALGTATRVIAMTIGGFGIAALIYANLESVGVSAGLFEASMLTLSVLTVPHMVLATIVGRAEASAA